MDATTIRASTVSRSMPTRETRTQASMTMPLSSTRSRTSMRLLLPRLRSRVALGRPTSCFEQPADVRFEVFRQARLRQEDVGAHFERAFLNRPRVVAGQQDDAD